MAQSLSLQGILDFQRAILSRDVAGVRAAIEAGIDPAMPITNARMHPLEWLMTGAYGTFAAEAKAAGVQFTSATIPTEEEFVRRGAEIVELLLSKNIKLSENVNFTSKIEYLADRFLDSPYRDDLADIVLQTIQQTLKEMGNAYQPDSDTFIYSYLKKLKAMRPDVDMQTGIESALTHLQDIHDSVQQRLEHPQTALERGLTAMSGEALAYWKSDFKDPPVENIVQLLSAKGAQDLPLDAVDAAGMEEEHLITELPKKSPQEVLQEISEMVGMEESKNDIQSLVFRAQFDAARVSSGLKPAPHALNSVFEGNAGTGKTTMARHQAELLHALDLTGNKYVEINYDNMMELFSDKTGSKMVELFDSADIIFLDGVSSIVSNKYGAQDIGAYLIDALTSALQRREGELTVFFSGSEKEMKEFFADNPVLNSNITHYQHLKSFTSEEMGKLLDRQVAEAGLEIAPEARQAALEKLQSPSLSNVHAIKSLLKQVPDKMAARLFGEALKQVPANLMAVPSKKDLSTITRDDIEAVEIKSAAVRGTLGFGTPASQSVKRPSP